MLPSALVIFALLTITPQPPLAGEVRSASVSAVLERGAVVRVANLLTGELLVGAAGPELPAALGRLAEREMSLTGTAATDARRDGTVAVAGARWTQADGTPRASAETRLWPDPVTGDLLVEQKGTAIERGVFGIGWRLGDIGRGVEVLVPGNTGQRFVVGSPEARREFEYPIGWEAGFVLIQGATGGLLVRADDSPVRFKSLVLECSASAVRLRFDSRNSAPWEQRDAIASSRWRITAYRGGWRVGAALYRKWLVGEMAPVPVVEQKPDWVRRIQFVVTMALDLPTLRALASRCEPSKTLLYLPLWRRDEYDRNYPDYTAAAGFEEFSSEAHRLGFRIMPHVNYFGCDPKHPLYARFESQQMRDPFSGDRLWWDWARANPPIKFAYINPASAAWREELTRRLKDAADRYSIDAYHLDQTLCIYNDRNGAVDGLDCIQGSRELHRALRRAMPAVALSGEGLNEVTCGFEGFAQRHLWGLNHSEGTWSPQLIDLIHPVSAAIVAPYTVQYGYLGMCSPEQGALFAAWLRGYERIGVIPTLPWPTQQLGLGSSSVDAVLRTARFFQRTMPVPDFEAEWAPDDLFLYRLADGGAARFRRDQGVALVAHEAGTPEAVIARRVVGVSVIRTGGSVPGWPAYDGQRVFALNPASSYAWSPTPPDLSAPHLTATPADMVLVRTGIHSDLVRFELKPVRDRSLISLTELVEGVAGGVALSSNVTRRAPGPAFDDVLSGALVHPDTNGLFIHPPWRADVGQKVEPGSSVGTTWTEYALDLPVGARITFQSAVRLNDGAEGKSDGATFTVSATDGAEVVRTAVTAAHVAPTPLELDLSKLAGKRVTLRIEVGPGPRGDPSFDWARVEHPVVRTEGVPPGPAQTVTWSGLPRGARVAAAQGAPSLTRRMDGAYDIHVGLPNTVLLTWGRDREVVTPMQVTAAICTGRVLEGNGRERPAYDYFAPSDVTVACGGVQRRAISLHPAPSGCSVADISVHLPADAAVFESFVGIKDGSKSDGVAFRVEVNGRRVAERTMRAGAGWFPLRVDLSPWRGKSVVLSLVTDPAGAFDFDWAHWGDPRIVSAKGDR